MQGHKQDDRYSLQPEDKISLSPFRPETSGDFKLLQQHKSNYHTLKHKEHAIVQVLSCVQRFLE